MQISIEAKGLDKLQEALKNIQNKAINTAPLMAELASHLYDVTEFQYINMFRF